MKNFFLKIIFMMTVLPALVAGILIFGGWGSKLPAGVYINGIYAGGMRRSRAAAAIREAIASDLANHSLTVRGSAVYSYSYPEINFTDNIKSVISSVRGAGEYSARVDYYLNGLDEVVSGICAAEFKEMRPAAAYFNSGEGQPFTYESGSDGAVCNGKKLRESLLASLSSRAFGGDFAEVEAECRKIKAEGSVEELKRKTSLLSAYTTYFDGDNAPRVSNIRLASQKISGCVLQAGEVFSFNSRVGARTEKNGFRKAKIIEEGRFVYGTGGGVCQVSTTVYNAALLAGLSVTEYHPHSLAVGYVSPSRDAMVSGTYSDLKVKNSGKSPVYIRMLTGKNYVRCEVYGLSDGAQYSLSSQSAQLEDGSTESVCYLAVTRGGVTYEKLLRRDKYLPAKSETKEETAQQSAVS